jgi:hypothetical protein
MMRRCLNEALAAARGRRAFGRAIAEYPLLRRQLMKIMLPTEQALSMYAFSADTMGKADKSEKEEANLLRILTPVYKFRACRDNVASALPPVQARCAALQQSVFPVLADAGIPVAGNTGLYLAWDFTVASAENNIGRLRHMRDDAFIDYLGQVEDASGNIVNLGRARLTSPSQGRLSGT